MAAYSTSLVGLFALTRALSVEGGPLGIKLNTEHPAAHTRILAAPQVEESILFVAARASRPAEQVSPVVALFAHESRPVMGECVSAAGGFVIRLLITQTPGVLFLELLIERLRDR